MTVQQQMTAAAQFSALWKTLLPTIRVPDVQFVVWAGTYTDEEVSRGITRAAAKMRKMESTAPMSVVDCIAYATSVMRNESLGIRRHAMRVNDAACH